MINELAAGNRADLPALLRLQKIGNSNNGGVFARGILEDNGGQIAFICFEAAQVDKLRKIEGPTVFMVEGNVEINKFSPDMKLQIIVQKLDRPKPDDDLSDLLPRGDFNLEAYKTRLDNHIKSVRTTALRALLAHIFSGQVYEKFITNPAGTRMHHAYLGGLLKHSVDVTDLALAIASKIEDADTDLVVTGALLHDLGKIREISQQIGFPYTDEGRLLGHISLTSLMVMEAAAKLKIPFAQLERLQHVLLAHHGDNEKGSPVACATREAFIVHYADEINAVMNQFEEREGKGQWEYNRMLQRNLLVGKL